ncbi:unnamed protein product, partial [Rotaria sp. Silwood1]
LVTKGLNYEGISKIEQLGMAGRRDADASL